MMNLLKNILDKKEPEFMTMEDAIKETHKTLLQKNPQATTKDAVDFIVQAIKTKKLATYGRSWKND
jgi:hypothetical protein